MEDGIGLGRKRLLQREKYFQSGKDFIQGGRISKHLTLIPK
jgi:hypothetical protein